MPPKRTRLLDTCHPSENEHVSTAIAVAKEKVEDAMDSLQSLLDSKLFDEGRGPIISNPPIRCVEFSNSSHGRMICVLMACESGTDDYSIHLASDGRSCEIRTPWPSPMYNFEELFASEIEKESMFSGSSQIAELYISLRDARSHMSETPYKSTMIKFPKRVHVLPATQEHFGRVVNGAAIICATFTLVETEYYRKRPRSKGFFVANSV